MEVDTPCESMIKLWFNQSLDSGCRFFERGPHAYQEGDTWVQEYLEMPEQWTH